MSIKMTENKYKYEFLDPEQETALIKLNENVLGGNDALEFTATLEELSSKGAKLIIADLKNVSVMNSSGLGMLVSALSNLKNTNVAFVLSSVPKKVLSLLEMTHLDKVFSIYKNNEAAASHLD